MTDPKLFCFSPDTAHLHLAGMDVAKMLDRYKDRLMLADYKDAKTPADQADRSTARPSSTWATATSIFRPATAC